MMLSISDYMHPGYIHVHQNINIYNKFNEGQLPNLNQSVLTKSVHLYLYQPTKS